MTPIEINRLFNKMGCDDIYKKICIYAQMYKQFDPDFPNEGYARCTITGMIVDHLNLNIRPMLHTHITKIVRKYPLSFFTSIDNVRAFIDGYKDFVNKLDEFTTENTGETL